jgi:hypothetical protein
MSSHCRSIHTLPKVDRDSETNKRDNNKSGLRCSKSGRPSKMTINHKVPGRTGQGRQTLTWA